MRVRIQDATKMIILGTEELQTKVTLLRKTTQELLCELEKRKNEMTSVQQEMAKNEVLKGNEVDLDELTDRIWQRIRGMNNTTKEDDSAQEARSHQETCTSKDMDRDELVLRDLFDMGR